MMLLTYILEMACEQRLTQFFFFGGGAGVTAHQDYFTHFEPSQSYGGAKTGDPQEKTPDHPQAELGLSHKWPSART